jgi:SAM-dependent methyltransferase
MVERSMMENALSYVGRRLRSVVALGDVVVDATVGNGHDTLLLAELVGENGVVYGFDVQSAALENTRQVLASSAAVIRLLHAGHQDILQHVAPEHHGNIAAVVFNLGYLPGGDKSITTMVETTVLAIQRSVELLRQGGIITIVCYRHPEGEKELTGVRAFVENLPQEAFTVMESNFINQRGNPPVVIVVLKR